MGAIVAAVPAGRWRPAHVSLWLDEALAHPCTAHMTRRSLRTYNAVVRAIANSIHPTTMTTTFSWASLAESVCRLDAEAASSRRTIARYLALLGADDVQLLATVASGRRGCCAPGGCRSTAKPSRKAGTRCLTPGQCPPGDSAIYVLCTRASLSPVADDEAARFPDTEEVTEPAGADVEDIPNIAELLDAGDIFGTPPPEGVSFPVHASAREAATPEIEPLRGTDSHQGRASAATGHPERESVPWWPLGQATRSLDDRRVASRMLARRVPAIRYMSDRDIASVCRLFFVAGWTVNDLLYAIDHQPGGAPWPHSGADGIDRRRGARGWLRYRLAAWVDEHGTVRRSRSQRAQDARVAQLARQRAARERAARDAVAVAAAEHSPAVASAKAQARAAIAAARLAAKRPEKVPES